MRARSLGPAIVALGLGACSPAEPEPGAETVSRVASAGLEGDALGALGALDAPGALGALGAPPVVRPMPLPVVTEDLTRIEAPPPGEPASHPAQPPSAALLAATQIPVMADECQCFISGDDDRTEVASSAFPYSAIVWIGLEFPGNHHAYCSGALVHSNFVLTAAHCVYSHDYAAWAISSVVIPALHTSSDEPFGRASADHYYMQDLSYITTDNPNRDIAMIRLSSSLVSAGHLDTGAYAAADLQGLTTSGYPCDHMPPAMTTGPGTTLTAIGRLVTSTHDICSGQSGSPLYRADHSVGAVLVAGSPFPVLAVSNRIDDEVQAWIEDTIASCQCSAGPCCNGCLFAGAATACAAAASVESRCAPSGCGGTVEERTADRYCPGTASTCTGALVWNAWQTVDRCTSGERCVEGTNTASCQAGCTFDAAPRSPDGSSAPDARPNADDDAPDAAPDESCPGGVCAGGGLEGGCGCRVGDARAQTAGPGGLALLAGLLALARRRRPAPRRDALGPDATGRA